MDVIHDWFHIMFKTFITIAKTWIFRKGKCQIIIIFTIECKWQFCFFEWLDIGADIRKFLQNLCYGLQLNNFMSKPFQISSPFNHQVWKLNVCVLPIDTHTYLNSKGNITLNKMWCYPLNSRNHINHFQIDMVSWIAWRNQYTILEYVLNRWRLNFKF